jgi:uncharacterized protein
MRIYYASDIHGSEKLWRKFLNAASFYEADVLIMGGDLTGKVMVPLVERKPQVWVARVFGKDQKAKGDHNAAELERRIRLNGFYPLRCDEDEYQRLQHDEVHRDAVFKELMRAELNRWMQIAADKLGRSTVRCFVMPGNDDEWDIDDVLHNAPAPVESVEGRVDQSDAVGFAPRVAGRRASGALREARHTARWPGACDLQPALPTAQLRTRRGPGADR